MALMKTYQVAGMQQVLTDFGVVSSKEVSIKIDNAYVKVESVSGSKEVVTANVTTTAGDISKAKFYQFRPDLDGPNFIKQAYEHLKTLPEFIGAVDC